MIDFTGASLDSLNWMLILLEIRQELIYSINWGLTCAIDRVILNLEFETKELRSRIYA